MYIVTYFYQGERKIDPIVHRELLVRFKGFQELRIHHLAIGINKSYCSHGNQMLLYYVIFRPKNNLLVHMTTYNAYYETHLKER